MAETAERPFSPLHFQAQLCASARLRLEVTILHSPPRVVLTDQQRMAEFVAETERIEAILRQCTGNCGSKKPTDQQQ